MVAGLMALLILAGAAGAEVMKLAVTTSFQYSGLAEVLLPVIAKELDLEVQLLVVGTGQAIKLGEAGDVDAILVHSKTAEEKFVAAGYGTHRREIMYNDFVFIGPEDDPASISEADSAIAALSAVSTARSDFVSRGDDSGTHEKERALWAAAGLDVEAFGPWYKEVGQGMGAALNTAAGMGAYIIADRASWLNFGNKSGMALLYSGDPALFNQYAYLPVNPAKHAHVKHDAAMRLEAWLVSDRARGLIDGYLLGGEQLFHFNAE